MRDTVVVVVLILGSSMTRGYRVYIGGVGEEDVALAVAPRIVQAMEALRDSNKDHGVGLD